MAKRVRVVGLISDTHGLLREAALKALEGSDLIMHAGDIGKLEILDALRALAPVVAVREHRAMGVGAANNRRRAGGRNRDLCPPQPPGA